MSRRKARECALQALYQYDLGINEENPLPLESGLALSEADYEFFSKLTHGTWENKDSLDKLIGRFLKKGWELHRLSVVDRAILRMATHEILHHTDTPEGVILNEAVEMTHTYSDGPSSRFINGVLAALAEEVRGKESST